MKAHLALALAIATGGCEPAARRDVEWISILAEAGVGRADRSWPSAEALTLDEAANVLELCLVTELGCAGKVLDAQPALHGAALAGSWQRVLRQGDAAGVRLLLARGAQPDAAALQTALSRPDAEPRLAIARILLAAGAPVGVRDERGRTALHVAAAARDAQLAVLLLEHGADPTARSAAGNSPADFARALGDAALETRLRSAKR